MIVGIDEVGRGALAGPVVAAACVLPEATHFPVLITDSKQMTPAEREESFVWLTQHCIFGIGSANAQTVDQIGIVASTEIAMQHAVAEVAKVCSDLYLLVDGRDGFWFDWPHSSIIHGDELEPAIGAASIIAKVTRDHLMVRAATAYKEYGFDTHKGYGAPSHLTAIRKHGPSAFHRKSFLRRVLEGQ
jgi:ribonuclease HII